MIRPFWLEVKYEFLKLARTPTYRIFTLAFPLMFYIFFGLVMAGKVPASVPLAKYLVGTYGAFGVVGVALFGFGVGVAVERRLGWLLLKRASPMMPISYMGAKVIVSMLFCILLTSALFALGFYFGGVRVSVQEFLQLELALVIGGWPFCLMGLAVGNLFEAQSAPAVMNVLYLPMSFASGLWVPIEALPQVLQQVAPAFPPYHLAQLALAALGLPARGSTVEHVAALAAFTLIFAGVAWLGYLRERETM